MGINSWCNMSSSGDAYSVKLDPFKLCLYDCYKDIMFVFKQNKVRVTKERVEAAKILCGMMCYSRYKKF
jgi:hypothetical protein